MGMIGLLMCDYLLKLSIYPLSKGFPVFVEFCPDPRTPTFPFPHIYFPIRKCVCAEVGWLWMDVCVEIKMIYKTNIILPL